MSRERPDASVVVPTCNRRVLLSRALDALSRQRHPMDRFEVLVVIDGSTDDTAEMLESYRAPFTLRVIDLPDPLRILSGCGEHYTSGKDFFQETCLSLAPGADFE